jgi:hypothetical protein
VSSDVVRALTHHVARHNTLDLDQNVCMKGGGSKYVSNILWKSEFEDRERDRRIML